MLTPLAPLDPHRLFSAVDVSGSPTVLVAVSGGGDSMALLDLAGACFGPGRIAAATVDHGLRQGSAAEAQAVADFCAARGIRHLTLRWDGAKPSSGLQAAARAARYRLLAQAARDLGATILLVGHTADDQAETVSMRAARGSGRGMAGMAPATLLDGWLWLVRPLLGIRRTDLRAHLARRGLSWFDDPTNENPAYERVRTRRDLSGPGAVEHALALAEAAAEARRGAGEAAARLIRACSMPFPGLFRLDARAFTPADPAAVYALRLLLATAGGTPHLPDEARSAALLARFCEPRLRATLSRAAVERRGDAIWLRREARGLPASGPPPPSALWDGRYRLSRTDDILVAPLAGAARTAVLDDAVDAPPALARAALATCPVLAAEPAAKAPAARLVAAPFASLLADFDLAPAAALAALVGDDPPPATPCRRPGTKEA